MTTIGNTRRCAHVKSDGERCLAYALKDSEFCYMHDPATAADRAESRRRGGRNSKRQIRYAPSEPGSIAIQTPGDVLQVLEDELNILLELEPSIARARTVGYLCAHALKALEVAELEQRLEALESAVFSEKATNSNGRY